MRWVRKCPQCGARLEKEDPREPWRCACGWQCAGLLPALGPERLAVEPRLPAGRIAET